MSRWLTVAAACLCACGGDGAAPDAAPATVDARVIADADGNVYLSQTGLYSDIDSKTVTDDAIEFVPRFVLWSDAAVKRRWLLLPPGATLDTSDPDHWELPVGGKVFKEFRSAAGTLLETRLVERIADTGNSSVDYWRGAFVWRADGSDATLTVEGAENVNGTQHDVPSQVRCDACHNGEPGFILGVSLVQLSGTGEHARLADLVAMNRVSDPPQADFVTPGDATTASALGYLHANCGHCHSQTGAARPDVDMTLRLSASDTTVEGTQLWMDTVGQPLTRYMEQGITLRIAPGLPDESGILRRMNIRDGDDQMPPIASEQVHAEGVATVRAWILSMPQQ